EQQGGNAVGGDLAERQPAKISAGEICDDCAEPRPDQVCIDVIRRGYLLCDIVLCEFHRRAEKPAGESDEQDPPPGAAASGDGEAPEKAERQVEKYVCNEV